MFEVGDIIIFNQKTPSPHFKGKGGVIAEIEGKGLYQVKLNAMPGVVATYNGVPEEIMDLFSRTKPKIEMSPLLEWLGGADV